MVYKCKMCGGDLALVKDSAVAQCEYCGSIQTVPGTDNEKKLALFSRANRLRFNCEFDKAAGVYETIVADFPEEAEAYWGLVLCKYGIEYVDDPATGKKIPTCHRSSFCSVMEDSDFDQTVENADVAAKKVYHEEAKAIEKLRKSIIEVSAKEEPYDIFICYKETDEHGERTLDSVLAQDIYDALTEKKYRVFFARISLEDKLGQAYEPYIFAALNSAKVMLAVGTDYTYFDAVWVKNEWSRYLKLMVGDHTKHLIPCFKGIDAYDMPKEFAKLQALDLGKVGAMQDLLRGINKILHSDKSVKEVKITTLPGNIEALVKRATIFLEDGDIESAAIYCEKALDMDPECAEVYIVKLAIDLGLNSCSDLSLATDLFDKNPNYLKAVRFGDESVRAMLSACLEAIEKRNERARVDGIYTDAVAQMAATKDEKGFWQLARRLEGISDYKDAGVLAEQCRKKAEVARKDAILVAGKAYMDRNSESIFYHELAIKEFEKLSGWKNADELIVSCKKKVEELKAKAEKRVARKKKITIIAAAIMAASIMLTVLWITVLSPLVQYGKAQAMLEQGSYDEAIASFTELAQYKDSAEKVLEATYAKAGALAESGDYSQAADIYLQLGDYQESAALYPKMIADYTGVLLEQKAFKTVEGQLVILAKYSDYAEILDKLYVSLIDAYYAEGMYGEALSAYGHSSSYEKGSDKHNDMAYKYAESLLKAKDFVSAKNYFGLVEGYLDAAEKKIECDYQRGLYELSKKNYGNAISAFENVKDYKDSEEQIKTAKYQYILSHKNRTDITTHTYLKELKKIKYKDSADVFKALYAWKAEIIVNDDEDNETKDMTSISKYSTWYFHVKITGGEPGAEATFKYKGYFPDGDVLSGKWDFKMSDGDTSWCSFYYNTPAYGKQGKMKVKIYDNNKNLIGEKTVKITG